MRLRNPCRKRHAPHSLCRYAVPYERYKQSDFSVRTSILTTSMLTCIAHKMSKSFWIAVLLTFVFELSNAQSQSSKDTYSKITRDFLEMKKMKDYLHEHHPTSYGYLNAAARAGKVYLEIEGRPPVGKPLFDRKSIRHSSADQSDKAIDHRQKKDSGSTSKDAQKSHKK